MENENFIPDNITTTPPVRKKDYMYKPKLIICIIGMVLGILLLISAIVGDDFIFRLYYYSPDFLPSAEYGADFYTDIYKAVNTLNDNTARILCSLDFIQTFFIMTGFGFLLGFGYKLFDLIGKHKEIMES